jgi:transcriptional regulator with XRE-family HTH domain
MDQRWRLRCAGHDAVAAAGLVRRQRHRSERVVAALLALMARAHSSSPDAFGPRLVRLSQARGLTQGELGALVGLSNRMIAYYERDDAEPPGPILAPLARALKVSTDELLGLAPLTETMRPRTARLMKRLQQIEELPRPSNAPCSRWSMPSSSIAAHYRLREEIGKRAR